MKTKKNNDSTRLANYFAVVNITPGILAILAYEFLAYCMHLIRPGEPYDPVVGLGILIPMVLMTELFSFIFSRFLKRKVIKVTDAIRKIAKGDYSVRLDNQKLAPFNEVAESINQMAEDLGSVETLRKEFIGDFSHEFKTPIVSINGFANLLLEEEVDEEERKEYLQIIADESDRLSKMALQTMLMSRLDSQTHVTEQKTFSLDDQIRQKIILLSASWEEKKIDMDVDLGSMTYVGDPELTSHIWINLLNNSIKFTPENGRISVRGEQAEDGTITVSISDTGKGMTEEECGKIFNRYYQADPSHATKGLGLGLSIVHRVVELCGGSIGVTSKPQEGSTFTVTLPVDRQDS